jgi:DNA-binding response OmpR family regulator
MLLIMAETGTTFSGVLASYRAVMFVLMVFAAALLIACLVFLATIVTLNRRIGEIERTGIQVSSLILSREERVVLINNLEFKLTEAAMETLSVLAEARLDDEVLTGAQIEAMVSGKAESDVDEAAGATRIKRLRDTLGNQMVSELLVKNIARRGYVLSIDKDVIRMI